MPRANFGDVPDAADYSPTPPGVYTVKIVDCIEGESRGGDDMWTVTLKIVDGDHRGKTLKDRLTWSVAALPRVKIFLHALGIDVSGDVDVEGFDVVGGVVDVDLVVDEFEGRDGPVKVNKVTFAGYRPASGEAGAFTKNAGDGAAPDAEADDIPFALWLPIITASVLGLLA